MSCIEKEHLMTKQEMQRAVDASMTQEMKLLKEQAAIDLDHRLSIEVKPKTDSIVEAAMNGNTKAN